MISILMPCFNAAPFLKKTIDSIIEQSYKDWELIIVNDHSTDDSAKILTEYSNLDPRISFYTNKYKGIISALQMAYAKSKGNMITRMDADDLMAPEKLAIMKRQHETSPQGCTVGKVSYFSDGTLAEGYTKYANWLNQLIDNQSHYEEIYKECVIPSPCWMMTRERFDQIGGFNSIIYPEDYDLAFRMYQHKVKINGVDKIIHHWRDHESRASRNDPNYSNQAFYPLKIRYFQLINWDQSKILLLWGAGKSAKELAKLLIKENMEFRWITGNPNKQGHNIYGITLESEDLLNSIHNAQLIIAVKEPNFKTNESSKINTLRMNNNELYFFH